MEGECIHNLSLDMSTEIVEDEDTVVHTAWSQIIADSKAEQRRSPVLSQFLDLAILQHRDFVEALGSLLATKLATGLMGEEELTVSFVTALRRNMRAVRSAIHDLVSTFERDPACVDLITPFLYFKGYHALQSYRVANVFWHDNQKMLAQYIQSSASAALGVDIHPAARIGHGIMMDHATGVVIGETAVVEDNVSILHAVTLGGTGKETGDRHPKVRRGVLIGAGSKIIGNIEIGEGSKVGAGSVVLEDVPPHVTVAGVPAVVVGRPVEDNPALIMDQSIGSADDDE